MRSLIRWWSGKGMYMQVVIYLRYSNSVLLHTLFGKEDKWFKLRRQVGSNRRTLVELWKTHSLSHIFRIRIRQMKMQCVGCMWQIVMMKSLPNLAPFHDIWTFCAKIYAEIYFFQQYIFLLTHGRTSRKSFISDTVFVHSPRSFHCSHFKSCLQFGRARYCKNDFVLHRRLLWHQDRNWGMAP